MRTLFYRRPISRTLNVFRTVVVLNFHASFFLTDERALQRCTVILLHAQRTNRVHVKTHLFLFPFHLAHCTMYPFCIYAASENLGL